MNYCTNYYNSSRALETADEINIKMDESKTLKDLQTFFDNHPSKRINLLIENALIAPIAFEVMIKNIRDAASLCDREDIYIRLMPNILYPTTMRGENQDLLISYIDIIKKYEMKYYLGYLLDHLLLVYYFINLGVSEVYITENVGFQLKIVREMADEANIKIRAIPNITQTSFKEMSPIKGFFIRPEDVSLYEKYIDTLEFYGDADKNAVLIDIYKQGSWSKDLSDIVEGMIPISNQTIDASFAERRVNCAQKCFYKKYSCKYCEMIFSLAKTLEKSNLKLIDSDYILDGVENF